MVILGVDPSLRATGYGVIAANANELRGLEHGTIRNPASRLPSRCLVHIADTLRQLIDRHQPSVLVVEGLVFVQNPRIALTLGQVRGVVIAAAAASGLTIYEYAPRKVKQAVTGLGGAGKTQVGNMVKALLGLPVAPGPDDGDALALAICHAQNCRGLALHPPRPI
jgi:crossover junction endodeoxyribonuclease RuvC